MGAETGDKKLGQILLEAKLVSSEQLASAMAMQVQMNSSNARFFKLGEVLLFQKALTMPQLHEALRQQTKKADSFRKEIEAIQERAETFKSIVESERKTDVKSKGKTSKSDGDSISRIFSFLKKKKV